MKLNINDFVCTTMLDHCKSN